MANLRDIRRRIRSVASTRQITRAMKMVAAAKLKRMQQTLIQARPYAEGMDHMIASLIGRVQREKHPLLRQKPFGKPLYLVVISGDRGLCGAFNSNIFRQVHRFLQENQDKPLELILVGKKAKDHFKGKNNPIHSIHEPVHEGLAETLMENTVVPYSEGKIDGVMIIYTEFLSVMRQRVAVRSLLPINPEAFKEAVMGEYIYEPSADALIDPLLTRHFMVQWRRILLESMASEQAARMTAMEGATRNAEEMIEKLTLYYNRVRQASITKELIEIVSGAQSS